MADCCTGTPLDIGCFGSCATVVMTVTTPQAGAHIIKDAKTGKHLLTVTLSIGAAVTFTNPFNEDSCTTFKIQLPDGNNLTSGGTDCFVVETIITGVSAADSGNCGVVDVVFGGDNNDNFVNS